MKTVAISSLKPFDLTDAIGVRQSGADCVIYYAGDVIPVTPPTQAQLDAVAQQVSDVAAANAHAKLSALRNMSPAQVQIWVAANVTTLLQAQDAIATLAIAVSILSRRM